MRDSTSSPRAAQHLATERAAAAAAAASPFPPLCVYFHRTFYSPPSSSFASLSASLSFLPSLVRRCFSHSFLPACLACTGEDQRSSRCSSTERQATPDSDTKEVFLDPSYIVLRTYCALANLQLRFVPLRYPSSYAAATLPAAWCDDRLLDMRQLLVLLQQTRDVDALVAASSHNTHQLCKPAAADGGSVQKQSRRAAAETASDAGHACTAYRAASQAQGTAAAAGDRDSSTRRECLEKELVPASAARAPPAAAATVAAADDSDAEMLRRGLQQQSAAVAAFIQQRLGAALHYILWAYEPCRRHFTFRVFRQNLPLVYTTPLLLWERRKALQQEQATPLKVVLLDILAVLELLDLQRLQQKVRRQRQQVEKKQQQQQELQAGGGEEKQQQQQHRSFSGGASSPVSGSASFVEQSKPQQQQLLEDEAATTVETAPGTEAAATAEEDEENKERKQCLTTLFAADEASEVEEEARLQPEFLLVPEAPTSADVYLYAYLFVLLQLPPHLLPWHEEESTAAAFSSPVPSRALASPSSSAAARRVAVAPAAANEHGWLSSDTSLLNSYDGVPEASSAAEYQWLQQQQDNDIERINKVKIVKLLPLARQYLQHFNGYLLRLRGASPLSSEKEAAAATASRATRTAAACVSGTETTCTATTAPEADASSATAALVQAGETEAACTDWKDCFASLSPVQVHACSAARAALYDRTCLERQERWRTDSLPNRADGSGDDDAVGSSSSSTSSSTAAARASTRCGVSASAEAELRSSNTRDRRETKCRDGAVSGKSVAAAAASHAKSKRRFINDSATRGFLTVAAAAAVGASVLYIGSTTRSGYRCLTAG